MKKNEGAVIEYIDVEEASNCLIAINNNKLIKTKYNNKQWKLGKPTDHNIYSFTHCEIHPSLARFLLRYRAFNAINEHYTLVLHQYYGLSY